MDSELLQKFLTAYFSFLWTLTGFSH